MQKIIGIIFLTITLIAIGCSSHDDKGDSSCEMAEPAALRYPPFEAVELSDLLAADYGTAPNPYDIHLDSAPDRDCVRIALRFRGNLHKHFNDSNHVHMKVARQMGIHPIHNIAEAWNASRPLVHIRSCREYYVDNLTHSYPYLVPEAATLLREIGDRFNDTLAVRGGGNYRIKVTSLLRTPVTVKRLRHVNRNASQESTHQYGTSFDISYSKFICDSTGVNRSFEDLKNLLAEILADMRDEGRCYVKHERKQSCFHITVRPETPAHQPADF